MSHAADAGREKQKDAIEAFKMFPKIIIIMLLLFIPFCAVIYIFGYMLINLSSDEIIYEISNISKMSVFNFVMICLVIYFAVFALGECFFNLKSTINSFGKKEAENTNQIEQKNVNQSENTKDENTKDDIQNKIAVMIFLIVAVIEICLMYISFTVYQSGKNSITQRDTVEVVTIDNQSYVIAGQYKDNWILKKCKIYENNIFIDKDHYVIKDIVGQDVIMRKLAGGSTLGDCLIDGETFSVYDS